MFGPVFSQSLNVCKISHLAGRSITSAGWASNFVDQKQHYLYRDETIQLTIKF